MRPRQDKSGGGSGQSGIRILTVALFLLLLTFFIMLNTHASVDERRKLEALGSLMGSFGVLASGFSPTQAERKAISTLEAKVPIDFSETDSPVTFESDMQSPSLVLVQTTPKGEVISIQERVIFDEGNYKIKPSSYFFLNKLCEIINQDEYPVEIAGHTDSRPPDEKSVGSNWGVSSLRALEILKFFVVIGKVQPERLIAYGCGGHRPIASNESRQTRAQNRRVDIILDPRAREGLKQIYQSDRSRFFVFKRFVFRIFD